MSNTAAQNAERNAPVIMPNGVPPFTVKSLDGLPVEYLPHYGRDAATGAFQLISLPESAGLNVVNAHAEHGLPVIPDGYTLASWGAEQEQQQADATAATFAHLAELEAADATERARQNAAADAHRRNQAKLREAAFGGARS